MRGVLERYITGTEDDRKGHSQRAGLVAATVTPGTPAREGASSVGREARASGILGGTVC